MRRPTRQEGAEEPWTGPGKRVVEPTPRALRGFGPGDMAAHPGVLAHAADVIGEALPDRIREPERRADNLRPLGGGEQEPVRHPVRDIEVPEIRTQVFGCGMSDQADVRPGSPNRRLLHEGPEHVFPVPRLPEDVREDVLVPPELLQDR